MKTITAPLVQHKTQNIQGKNAYRPIALVTTVSDILEIVVLGQIKTSINTSPNMLTCSLKCNTIL